MGKQRFMVIALGFAASSVFVYLAVRNLKFEELEASFRRAQRLPWLPIGIAIYLLGHVVRGVRRAGAHEFTEPRGGTRCSTHTPRRCWPP